LRVTTRRPAGATRVEQDALTANMPYDRVSARCKARTVLAKPYGLARWTTGSLRHVRGQRHPVQPRVAPRGAEFVTRKITLGVARIKLGLATELRLGNMAPAATGLRRGLRPRDADDAHPRDSRGLRDRHRPDHSVRELVDWRSDRRLNWRTTSCWTASTPAGRGGPAVRRPQERPAGSSLGAAVAFESWSR